MCWPSFLRSLSFVVSRCDIPGSPSAPGSLDDVSLPPLLSISEVELDLALSFFLLVSSLSFYSCPYPR